MRLPVGKFVAAGTALWCAAIVAAPLLQLEPVYAFFSIICHQDPARSWHLHGASLAVCIRCASIYMGFFAGLLFLRKPNPRWFVFALGGTGIQWLLSLTLIDSVLLRVASGILLGAFAAPIVRVGVEQMLAERVRTVHESL